MNGRGNFLKGPTRMRPLRFSFTKILIFKIVSGLKNAKQVGALFSTMLCLSLHKVLGGLKIHVRDGAPPVPP